MSDLNFEHRPFPPADRYPINSPEGKVYRWIKQELDAGPTLVVTGFSSLEFLVRTLSGVRAENKIRILIGQEPLVRSDLKWGQVPRLDTEMKEWWLERGFSILTSGPVLQLLSRMDAGRIEFRLLDQLHAKILVGPTAAILGSSNFSQAGLTLLKEANVRREKMSGEYTEIQQIAETYWEMGKPANDVFRDLLLSLLSRTSWEEVLAVAGSLLLEGEWLNRIPELARRFENMALWESQKQALSQALYLLDTYGDSLLIADPTGSGKTRLGAGLHLLVLLRLYSQGHSDRTRTLIVTPPQVKPTWEKEFLDLEANQPEIISQGMLSRPDSGEGVSTSDALKGCRVLFLDEAHNYLNHRSNRSTSLLGHGADHTVLFTATPINRRVEDLFRVLILMDPDNLSDEALKTFNDWRMHRRPQNEHDLAEIRRQISLFTIRRTKGDLNSFIAKNPEGYTREKKATDGTIRKVYCRYPQTDSRTYELNESDDDVEAAQEIDRLAWELRGVVYLRQFTAAPEDLSTPERQQRFLENRIKAANALAAWNIKSMLRSSRAALIEHIEGTARACQEFGLRLDDKKSGDLVGTLTKKGFPLPQHRLTIPLPTWMADPNERQLVLESEILTYQQIAHWCRRLSDKRESTKVELLQRLVGQHDRILAFDSKVITLEYLSDRLNKTVAAKNLVVTGGRKEEQRRARELFGLDSQAQGWIGLCSDAMAEGVNLQGARCLVLLDMPSVMRLAEQRIGRIDRMNSPFESIEVWWPDDHPSFALRTDKKFFLTAESVKNVLGSNIEIPELLTSRALPQPITGSTAIKLWSENAQHAEDFSETAIRDAFQDLKGLYSGPRPLVRSEVYSRVANLRVKTVWSAVISTEPWALVVTDEWLKAPRWTLWRPQKATIDLGEIVRYLRTVLPPSGSAEATPPEGFIREVCRDLERNELLLLPHKKRRALLVLARLILYWGRIGRIPQSFRSSLVQWAQSIQPDGELFAEQSQEASRYHLARLARRWLEIAEPELLPLRESWRRRRFLSWDRKEVYDSLSEIRLSDRQWQSLCDELGSRPPLEQRIKAVIWGVAPSK